MNDWSEAVWQNGKRSVNNWAQDSFTISLDSEDRVTGRKRVIVVTGEHPEWGNWQMLKRP